MYQEIDRLSEVFPQLPRQIIEEVYHVKGTESFETLWDLCATDMESKTPQSFKTDNNPRTPSNTIDRYKSPEDYSPLLESPDPFEDENSNHDQISRGSVVEDKKENDYLEGRNEEKVEQLVSDFALSVNCETTSQRSSQILGDDIPASEFTYFSDDDDNDDSAVQLYNRFQQNNEKTKFHFSPSSESGKQKNRTSSSSAKNQSPANQGSPIRGMGKDQQGGSSSKNPNPLSHQELVRERQWLGDEAVNQEIKVEGTDKGSESLLFLKKSSNSQKQLEDIDVNDMPLLPPGICDIERRSTDSDDYSSISDHSSVESMEHQEQENIVKKNDNLETNDNKQRLKTWTSESLVLLHCSSEALKFKMKSSIPDELLNTVIESCQSSSNFPHLKHDVKTLRLKVLQIARSIRQVSAQSIAILQILNSLNGKQELLYGYHILTQTLVKNSKSRNEDGIYSVALVIRHISSRHPLLMRMIISTLHKLSPLTVPMYWSHDEKSPEAKLEYHKLMSYIVTTEDDGESFESDSNYLTSHARLVQLYAALLVAAPKGEVFGMEEGWQYLSRLLNALPPNRITATALYAFLEFAGNRLFSTYGRQFEKILKFVEKRFIAEMGQEQGDDASTVSRLNTYILLQQYLEVPRCLEVPMNEESRALRA
eukprot:g6714.t1